MNKSLLHVRLGLLTLIVTGVLVAMAMVGYGLASAAPNAAAVTITPPSAAKQGARGSLITYTLRVTNTGDVADDFNMSVLNNVWPTTFTVSGIGTAVLPFAAGEGREVIVYVSIPPTASGSDVAIFLASTDDNSLVFDTATLTTTVQIKMFLPVMRRD